LGYRPLRLTLKGFKGVRSGVGRETLVLDLEALVGEGSLVAIAGANGRGKTTVMDNLHSYRCEFYVSQTPELTAMADRIIDLDEIVGGADEEV
jgi:ABC-type uncharacterized transport system ATPase subunit